jgi:predicted adenylyl cyclase CyaB
MNLKDNTEFEAKFYPVDKEEFRKKLTSLGATLLRSERKMTRVIADTRANSNLPKNSFIRIRDEGNVVRLSLKTTADASGNLSDQKEIDVDIGDFETTKVILETIGLQFNRRQETLREEWKYKNAEITIDTWPGLSTYSEIEAHSEEEVREIADELGFDWDKKIITAVAEIYEKVYGISIDEVLEKISDITFENNPFDSIKKVWTPKTQNES